MAAQTKRKLVAWAIFAVLCGALFALVRKPKFKERLLAFVSKVTQEVKSASGTEADSGSSETKGSSDDPRVTIEEFPDENGQKTNEDQDETNSAPAETTNQEQQNQTNDSNRPDQQNTNESDKKVTNTTQDRPDHTDQKTGADTQKKDSDDNELNLDFSGYGPAVRERLNKAKQYYLRAKKHNERVKDPSISDDRRLEENKKAQKNASRSLKVLRPLKEQLFRPDKRITTFLDRVKKIKKRSYRRAKMWGGY